MKELKLPYRDYQKSNETDSMKLILLLINERKSSVDIVTQSLYSLGRFHILAIIDCEMTGLRKHTHKKQYHIQTFIILAKQER